MAPQPGDDITCTITNTPLPADLAIAKAATPQVNAGETVTYLLVVTNNGRGDSSGYTVTDQIPAGLTNVSSSTPGCAVSGSTLTCTGGLLPAGQSSQITVTATADGTVELMRNTATVRGISAGPGTREQHLQRRGDGRDRADGGGGCRRGAGPVRRRLGTAPASAMPGVVT
ncbi:DUF11 domain-containing protein [Amycolatopsis thermoflava]|uniref:DUF11 domain-containing protein n=1 Tax=Amycolatopsis thermoflava TaxID=84480 RepID=UPI0036656F9A